MSVEHCITIAEAKTVTFKVRYKNKWDGTFSRSVKDGEFGKNLKTEDWAILYLPNFPPHTHDGSRGAYVLAFHEDWTRVEEAACKAS